MEVPLDVELVVLAIECCVASDRASPSKEPARRVDDRWEISGILHVLKSGCRWYDCPEAATRTFEKS